MKIDLFSSLCRKGMHIISNSFRWGHKHFTFQTLWMSERLLDQGKEGNKLYSGGLISDVTDWFFSSGYLLTTSMYCDNIDRWIPVQLSWIQGLSEDYYTIHFTVLFRQFLISSILPEEQEKLATSIVDFSQAQQIGFVNAYMKVFGQTSWEEALKKLNGCQEHFQQSITRVKRNCAVIRADEELMCFFGVFLHCTSVTPYFLHCAHFYNVVFTLYVQCKTEIFTYWCFLLLMLWSSTSVTILVAMHWPFGPYRTFWKNPQRSHWWNQTALSQNKTMAWLVDNGHYRGYPFPKPPQDVGRFSWWRQWPPQLYQCSGEHAPSILHVQVRTVDKISALLSNHPSKNLIFIIHLN